MGHEYKMCEDDDTKTFNFYRLKHQQIQAARLTVDNLKEVEHWCAGDIKGTSLPIEDRVIDMQNCFGEMRANIGDYIVRVNTSTCKRQHFPMNEESFFAFFEKEK